MHEMKNTYRYLIVDDDATNNLICEFTIQRFNQEAVIKLYNNPEEALNFIQKDLPNPEMFKTVLFLDVNMPIMTGFEFLKEFEKLKMEKKEHYKIFMLTSSIEDFSQHAHKYPRVKGFLAKPLKLSYLERIHRELQENYNSIPEE